MDSWVAIRREHDVIAQVLSAAQDIIRLSARPMAIPMPFFSGATEFFSAFVERCHEVKEEEALLPAFDRAGVLSPQLAATTRHDHDEARRLLDALRPLCARRTTEPELTRLLDAYVSLKVRHVEFENAEFAVAGDAVPPADHARVLADFGRIEDRMLGPGGRDVLLALAGALASASGELARRATPQRLTARDLVRPPQGTIGPDDSLARAADRMGTLGTRELAVLDADRFVGILTRTDLEPHRGHLEWTVVRAAMTADPVTVAADAPVPAVARLLLDGRFNGVPVLSGGRLVGIVRRNDLIALLADDDA